MQLISALRSGIGGAENGYLSLYQRGTVTPATWYADFEGTVSDSSGAAITLTANGSATVYVNELVLCVVTDVDGVEVCRFVDGHAAAAVEHRGQSFTGVNYQDASLGTGSNHPTDVQTVLNRWLDSAGALDWNVLVNGVTTTLQNAFGQLSGLLFNVKDPTYGAVGDGVANDTAAIAAALTAAGGTGGIVYFPPGTYLSTATLTIPNTVSLLGAGPNASAILINHASNGLLTFAAGSAYRYQRVEGLRLGAAQACSGVTVAFPDDSVVSFSNCHIGSSLSDGHLVLATADTVTDYRFTDCAFEIGAVSACAVVHLGGVKRALYRDCIFTLPAGTYAPTPAAVISANNIDLERCAFDGTLASAGTFSYFLANSTTTSATIRGCTFVSTGGGTATAITLGSYTSTAVFHESENVFGASGVTAYSYTVSSTSEGSDVRLVSRELRVFRMSSSAANPTVPTDQYGTIIVSNTGASSQTWQGTMAPDGATGSVIAFQQTGTSTDTGPDHESAGVGGFKLTITNTGLLNTESAHFFYRCAVVNNVNCMYVLAHATAAQPVPS